MSDKVLVVEEGNGLALVRKNIQEIDGYQAPTDEQTQEAVDAWMNEHSGSYVVPDWSLTYKKLEKGTLGFVTPEMYGAVGDGITDDTSAINNALSSGHDVYFAGGKTYVLKGIAEVKSNTHIRIDGTVLMGATGLCGFEIFSRTTEAPGYTGVHDVLIDGSGIIDGNEDLDGATDTLIRIGHCNNITIRGITLCNYHAYHAMEISGSNNVLVDGIKIYGFIYDSNYPSTSEAINIERIINETGTGGMIPYDNTQSNNVTIQNCVFGRDDSVLYMAIGNHNAEYVNYPNQNIIIRNNVFRNKAILPGRESTLGHKYNSVVLLDNAFDDLVIADNVFENINGNAIYIGQNSKRTKISGNKFKRIYGMCVQLATGCEDVSCTGNMFSEVGYKGTSDGTTNIYPAVYMPDTGSGITVSGNTFYLNRYELNPIYISDPTSVSYPNLSIFGNTLSGLSDYTSDATVYANAIARMDRYRNDFLFLASDFNSIVKTGYIALSRDIREFDYIAVEYGTELGNHETRMFDVHRALTINKSFKLDFVELGGSTLRVFQMRLAFTTSNYKQLSVSQNRKYTVASNTITEYSTSGTDQVFIGVYSIRGINLRDNIT